MEQARSIPCRAVVLWLLPSPCHSNRGGSTMGRWGQTHGQRLWGSHLLKDTVHSLVEHLQGDMELVSKGARRKKICSPCAGWTGQDITGWSCHQRHPGWVVETSELYRIAKTDRYLQDSSLDFCPGWHFDRLLTHTFCQELQTIISRTRQTLPGWAAGWMESHKLGEHMRMRTGQIARKSLLC